jgi:hypothetical protein
MELLLWLWFYDPRWFFNFKISILCYKNAWLIPLFLHLFLMFVCLYYLQISETFSCDRSLKLWLYSRTFFSFLISVTIVFFKFKIAKVYQKETAYFDNAKKIYPILNYSMRHYDYWIRRKSLISTPGILLLFLGLISLFWSYLIISFYHFQNYYSKCDIKIQKLLNIHSLFILLGNVPLILIIIILVFMKVGSLIAAFICPDCLISASKCCSSEKPKVEIIKYNV